MSNNPDKRFIVQLDQPREIKWTNRAKARIDALPRAQKSGGYYRLCALVWAAMVDRDHGFEEPEDLAEYLGTREQVKAAGEVLLAARKAAENTEKNGCGSTDGPSPSSS